MTRTLLSAALLATTLLAGCGSSSAETPSPSAGQRIELTEWKVGMPATLAAGQTTFDIANTGAAEHELIVFKTDLEPAQYPRQKSGDLNEDGAGLVKVSDGDNIAAGKSQSRTMDLTKPGKYLFVCNLSGHFAQGMYTVVTVAP